MSYSVVLASLTALKADADTFGKDDTYVNFSTNGKSKRITGNLKMGNGSVRQLNFNSKNDAFFGVTPDSRSATITLRDFDPGSDDFLGSHTISAAEGAAGFDGFKTAILSGSGSKYQLEYYVYDT